MNKVRERGAKDSCAKFLFASNRMFAELKYTKLFMYFLNVVPVVICFLPSADEVTKLICSCISFSLTLINEVASALLSSYKEKAILEHQIYESEITGSTFSKIEYDREATNDLNELAIRKGLPKMRKAERYPVANVPSEITDEYSYLYLCRVNASKTRFLLSRLFYCYMMSLIVIALVFIAANFTQRTTGQTLYLLICFWPLIIPIIRNCTSCTKCIRQCVKLAADIDNFFADGDDSVERLARCQYYVQNLEFEMMLTRPTIFKIVQFVFRYGVATLTDGVTVRFKESMVELKSRNLIYKGVISMPRGKQLITRTDYDLEALEKAQKKKQLRLTAADTAKKESTEAPKQTTGKTSEKKSAQKPATGKTTSGTATTKKTTKK